jgi:uncharacterized protein YdeI (YjbR/CyaY-like superfamily)
MTRGVSSSSTSTSTRSPADLAAALDAEPAARRRFDASSYSQQRRHVLAVEGAKAEATRQRRVSSAVATLVEEAGRAG